MPSQVSHAAALAYTTPCLLAVAACYLFGYWGFFGINVLEFVSFADLAKLAVYPLLASLLFAALGIVVAELTTARYLPAGRGVNTNFGQLLRKYYRWLLALDLLVH
jgi:hypothetical protein